MNIIYVFDPNVVKLLKENGANPMSEDTNGTMTGKPSVVFVENDLLNSLLKGVDKNSYIRRNQLNFTMKGGESIGKS